MGRPVKGVEQGDELEGTEEAKLRLKTIHEQMHGELTVEQADACHGVHISRFRWPFPWLNPWRWPAWLQRLRPCCGTSCMNTSATGYGHFWTRSPTRWGEAGRLSSQKSLSGQAVYWVRAG